MTRNALDGKIVHIRRGLAVYKVKASPFYRARIWLPAQKKRAVRTTKATNRVEAISAAESFLSAMGTRGVFTDPPKERTFEHFAERLVETEKARGESGKISPRSWSNTKNLLNHPTWGAVSYFGRHDVGEIETKDYLRYMTFVREQDASLSAGTMNHIAVVFRKVLSLAQNEGVIDAVPATPREKHKDNPRSFFRFSPLVSKKDDEYELLKTTAQKMARERVVVRGVVITEELYDFILFMTHSFLRPTESEIYALTLRDCVIAENPKRLIITIRKGKTGQRISNTMQAAVSIFQRLVKRHGSDKSDDYLFLPEYKNRAHARRIIQNQFNAVLERAGLKKDRYSDSVHTVYSLRHTAICMRLILSEGKVNIFNLAKNAGTSVDQIERFYARNLPLSAEMARNLQSFGN
ncbi:MAG: hypothetical protein ACRED7_12360 [Stellaceae bacterium]